VKADRDHDGRQRSSVFEAIVRLQAEGAAVSNHYKQYCYQLTAVGEGNLILFRRSGLGSAGEIVMKSKSPFLLRVGVLALAFAGAGAARAQDGITVYNAQHASLTQAWADGFTKETGIKVTIRKGSDTELANQIVQEGAASPADVFVTENSPAMVLVERAGVVCDPAQGRPRSGAGAVPPHERALDRRGGAQHGLRL
jgi:hypothetical protein